MKRLIFKNFLVLLGFFAITTLSSAEPLADVHNSDKCRYMRNDDARTNCYQLESVNRKLSRVLRILNRGNYENDYLYVKEYSCTGGTRYNGNYAGFGATPKLAMDNYIKFCTIAWSEKWCGATLKSCDFEESKAQTHFYCEIHRYTGVGNSKQEAMAQALRMCDTGGHSKRYCAQSFKKCYTKE